MQLTDTQAETVRSAQERLQMAEMQYQQAGQRQAEIVALVLDAHGASEDAQIRETEPGVLEIVEPEED